jgi:holo-[acyl-carrier protein] synthase
MILGTGIDLVEVTRIRGAMEKFGDRFLNRILRPAEVAYCLSNRDPAPFVAGRFAAKEAISKAFGTGIGGQLGWLDLEVCRQESGQPFVVLHGEGLKRLAERGGRIVHLSLSHTAGHATAVAILEGSGPV